jgi:hypothetical protein
MGRPGLTKHRKFRRLETALGSHIVARGALETLWDVAYENGDEYLGDADDVEAAARWEGEAGKLTQALLDAGRGDGPGFIEELEGRPGRYRVHDLWHHVPEYVRKRRKREDERRHKSDPITGSAANDSTLTGQRPPNDTQWTPSPDCQTGVAFPPAPAPAPNKTISSKPEGFDQALMEVWEYYLAKLNKNTNLYRFTTTRRSKGRARLEECCKMAAEPKLENAAQMMRLCIDRLAASTFHNGDNKQGKKYLDWDHLFRSNEKLASWLDDDLHQEKKQK